MKNINILTGGPSQNYPDDWEKLDGLWIGIDRGALVLAKNKIKMEIAIGDFDSIDISGDWEYIKRSSKLSPLVVDSDKKNDTDTELALEYILKYYSIDKVNKIRLIGSNGGRLDHYLSNIFMILQERFDILVGKLMILDQQNIINFYKNGKYTLNAKDSYKYISFITLGDVMNFSLTNFRYKLSNVNFKNIRVLTSNEFKHKNATLSFDNGFVAAIYSKDITGEDI